MALANANQRTIIRGALAAFATSCFFAALLIAATQADETPAAPREDKPAASTALPGAKVRGQAYLNTKSSDTPLALAQAVNIDAQTIFVACAASVPLSIEAQVKLADKQPLVTEAIVALPELGALVLYIKSETDIDSLEADMPWAHEQVHIYSFDRQFQATTKTNGIVSTVSAGRFRIDTSLSTRLTNGIVYNTQGKCLGIIAPSGDDQRGIHAVTIEAVSKKLAELARRLDAP